MRDVKEENEVVLGQATAGVMSVHATCSRGAGGGEGDVSILFVPGEMTSGLPSHTAQESPCSILLPASLFRIHSPVSSSYLSNQRAVVRRAPAISPAVLNTWVQSVGDLSWLPGSVLCLSA